MFAARRMRLTEVGSLVSRRGDRLGVCVGIRVNWCLSRRILELRHWSDFAVTNPTRAAEQKRGGSVWRCLQIN